MADAVGLVVEFVVREGKEEPAGVDEPAEDDLGFVGSGFGKELGQGEWVVTEDIVVLVSGAAEEMDDER